MSRGGSCSSDGIPGARLFNTTHWSVVLAAGKKGSPEGAEALEKLCRNYWFPLYSFLRRQGHNPEEAQDITQGFFAHFLQRDHLDRANPERGRFRTFLLTSLQNFVRHEWERAQAQKRGGGRGFIAWDEEVPEERYQLEGDPRLTPDQLFDQRWAVTLFQNALIQIEKEYAAGGKSVQFEELKRFLSNEPGEGDYARVASRLGLSSGAVAVAVHRLRQRYGELVLEEIAQTVASPGEAEEELHYLIKLMSA
jgi:RNA polymerase sigma-70 factor (ECF subfamily)